ncbi:hypothetical protein [Chitinophaga sp. S165]|uniref:hypothetical protein n=1 Tax=Chitinophaga sp. S165 TaxID=2135462 RepID=UPI000D716F7B|nr:hypothetical protein [Chitinophaga sp. S165]PWV53256.1 hypothetical protein C7475_1022 [Chitinophaga sp. S165]
MAKPKNITAYSFQVNEFSITSPFKTENFFDITHSEISNSPIDKFLTKVTELNRLILDPRDVLSLISSLEQQALISVEIKEKIKGTINNVSTVNPVMINLVLLGFISAIESYLREIISKLIHFDEKSMQACEHKEILYGAAIHADVEVLPETLLESTSFTKKDTIKDVIKDYLGLKGIKFPDNVNRVLTDFEKICHLRHCIVHRFGKLGASNALHLGLGNHKKYIDKPIRLDYNALQLIGVACTNTVKELNHFLWSVIMMRQLADPIQSGDSWKKLDTEIPWKWNFNSDRKRFKKYFDIFASQNAQSKGLVITMKSAYDEYKMKYKSLS